MKFPKNFYFGVATSAYQIEGAYNEDGKGVSIWDTFAHTEDKIKDNTHGDEACDHYHKYKEDVQILKDLGVSHYSFTIAWTRIFPNGFGEVNQKGVEFYNNLINELIANGIKPVITIYHWDMPQCLEDIGGWLNRDVIGYYVEYAKKLFELFGDRVDTWKTVNEPWVVGYCSYLYGIHAPGIKDFKTAVQVIHNVLVAHGLAVKAFRDMKINGEIGIVIDPAPTYALGDTDEDKKAIMLEDQFRNYWFFEPLLNGVYPTELHDIFKMRGYAPVIEGGDMDIISEPLDFIGIDYYTPTFVEYDDSEEYHVKHVQKDGIKKTEMDWYVYPQGMYDLMSELHRRYPTTKWIISENGAAFKDTVEDGEVHDVDRVNFIKGHIESLHKLVQEGVPFKGYFVWSLLDNFEWSLGLSKRFGIVHIDYDSKEKTRTLKDSAKWYKEFLGSAWEN